MKLSLAGQHHTALPGVDEAIELSRMALLMRIFILIGLLNYPLVLSASVSLPDAPEAEKDKSPWLFTPLVSSAPKFGTSIGAMAAYLKKFDEVSPASMFGTAISYSNTESAMIAVFANTYFDNDRQRLLAGAIGGEINNEYADFLGTGYPAQTTDNIHAIFVRYLYRVGHGWFLGPQVLSTNYTISGNDWFTQEILERIGLTGFDSNGIGLVAQRDTRDNQNSPGRGSLFNINNIAYRESFGGDASFDAYALNFSKYFPHGNGHVLAARIDGRWTHNAPPAGYSTIRLRGYTPGQYLAPYSTLVEVEERYHIKGKWGATAFVGVACLYGDGEGCGDGKNLYPAGGAGMTYILKPVEKMLARAEVAIGEGDNYGFYLKFGYEF